jgi:hypothetical protein
MLSGRIWVGTRATHRWVRVVLLWNALIAPACGVDHEDHDDPVESRSTTAVEVAPDWVHPACQPSALMPPVVDSCNGPWQINYQETWTDPGAAAWARAFATFAAPLGIETWSMTASASS